MYDYYICLNCGRIQDGRISCDRCLGAVKELSSEEVEEFKKKIFNKRIRDFS